MSTTDVVLLGVIAAATLVMAAAQITVLVFVGRLVRKVDDLGTRFGQDIQPLVTSATVVAEHAARASALAVAQMERADVVFSDLARRIDDTVAQIQGTILAPAREGRALLAAIGAVLDTFRDARQRRARDAAIEDDDPLFIG